MSCVHFLVDCWVNVWVMFCGLLSRCMMSCLVDCWVNVWCGLLSQCMMSCLVDCWVDEWCHVLWTVESMSSLVYCWVDVMSCGLLSRCQVLWTVESMSCLVDCWVDVMSCGLLSHCGYVNSLFCLARGCTNLRFDYSRAAGLSHPGTRVPGLSVRVTECRPRAQQGQGARSARGGRWLLPAAVDVAAVMDISAGPAAQAHPLPLDPSPRPTLFSLFFFFFFILSRLSRRCAWVLLVFSTVPSFIFCWIFV